jgi:hypothetical protein
MTDIDDTEDAARRRKKEDEGEGDSDSFGRGKAGAGAGMSKVKRLSPAALKTVMENWRHLDVEAVMQAVAEFFSDLPLRASANLTVAWEKTFAVVNQVIAIGQIAAEELHLSRSRARTAGRDTKGLANKRAAKMRPGMDMGPRPSGG